MGQQVSVEAALPVYRQRCSELHDETLILRARVNELEAEVAQLRGAGPALGSAPAQQTAYGDDANFDQQDHLERGHG